MTIDLLIFALLEVTIYIMVWRLSRHSTRQWKIIHANLAISAFNVAVVAVVLLTKVVDGV